MVDRHSLKIFERKWQRVREMKEIQAQNDLTQPKEKEEGGTDKSGTHLSMKFLHFVFPSALFIQSSSSLTSLSYGSSASSGNVFIVCSKISSSYLCGRKEGRKRRDGGQLGRLVQIMAKQRDGEDGNTTHFVNFKSFGFIFSRRFQYVYRGPRRQ